MSPAPPTVVGGVGDCEHTCSTGDDGVLLNEMAQLSVGDESSVETQVETSGSYSGKSNDGDGYSPSSKRYTPPFIRKCLRSLSEDPFQPTPKARTGGPSTPKSSRIMTENWRSESSSSGQSASDSPLTAKSKRKHDNSSPEDGDEMLIGSGRGIDTDNVVKAEDAQAIYPPSCCVFVANLLQSESEESLQMAVTQIFREFGPVYVKIRRDAKQMPFAFCQYTKAEHADRAIREGRGRLIRGRPCRCEKAKAHQFDIDLVPGLFLIERKFGEVITPEEARQLLQQFGNIELCYTASHVERTALNLNEGVIVQFELYDDGQNAYSAFRSHDVYKLQSIAGLASPTRSVQARSPPQTSDSAARAYLARYEVDRRSIFVGNLPAGTTIHQVDDLFGHFGHIEEILMRETTSKFDAEEKLAFAFIEYGSVNAVANAIATKNSTDFGGRIMRVTQKDSETSNNRIRQRAPAPINTAPAHQSPARRHPDLPVSPMSQMSPPGYGSPYAYPYSPYQYNPQAQLLDTRNYYMGAPYSPAYSYYSGSLGYETGTSATPITSSTAHNHPAYYGYPTYPCTAPVPYWGYSNPGTEQQDQSPVNYYPTTYNPTANVGTAPNDRSPTPTPAGHATVIEEPIAIQ